MQTTGKNLQNPFNFFDAVFLINLDERQDRLNESIQEFKKYELQLNIFRFPAIKYNIRHPMVGRAGCFASHRAVIQHAKNNNFKNILVFEDDFMFLENPLETLSKCVDFLSKNHWDLFYLGQTTTSEVIGKPLGLAADGILRLKGGLATHAIAYNNTIYDTLLNELPPNEEIINWLMVNESMDGWLMRNIQPKDEYKCYTTDPMLCVQRPSYSNIDNKFVDYSANLKIAFCNERAKIQT